MVDFSKVARQLSEGRDPETGEWIPDHQVANRQRQVERQRNQNELDRQERMARNPIVRRGQQNNNQNLGRFNKPGERGRRFEGKISELLNFLSPRGDNSISGSNHRVLGGRMKTDIINDDGVGYSVKTKMNNDDPMKVQQSSYDSTLWSKLNVPWSKRAQSTESFTDDIKGNKLAQALVMRFGSKFGSLDKVGELLKDELSPEQIKILQNFNADNQDSENPFMSNEEMFNAFPEHYDELLGHLNDNKYEIFNNLVRKAGGQNGDNNPIQRFISHISDEGVNGQALGVDSNDNPIYDFSGSLDVHDMSDETVQEAMKKLQWFGTGNRFYMAENETEDINERLLDLWPYDEEGTSWALRPGDGNRQSDVTPGFFKAMMSANPEVLERLFPSTLRGKIQFDRTNMRNVFKNLNNRNEEVMNFNKLHFSEGMDPIEQSAADKATQSTDMKRDMRVRSAQQKQMAQKSKTKEKASMVYNEHKAMEINRAYDRQKSDWKSEINEHRGAPAGEEETTHPYVDVMPMTDQKEKRAKAQMDNAKKVGVENASKMASEEFSFEAALDKLVSEAKETDNKAFQMMKDKYKDVLFKPGKAKSAEQKKADAAKRAKNYADNNKDYNPYKPRAGESD